MGLKTPLSDFYSNELFFGKISTYNQSTAPATQVKIKPSDLGYLDKFGNAVAAGCGRIVVGAATEDGPAPLDSGSAYIFNLNGTQLAKITASGAASYDEFGSSVAVGSGRIVVGAPYDDDNGSASGSAFIFDLRGNQIAKIKASDAAAGDYFGSSVAVGSGRIVVGSYLDDDNGSASGSAYIFDLNGNQIAKIKASDAAASDYFGRSVAAGNGRIVVGSPYDDVSYSDSGSAYIFDLNGNQIVKISASDPAASDYFGWSVAAGNGIIVVGAYGDDDNGSTSGSAYIYDLAGTQLAKIKASDGAASDNFGYSVAVGCGRIVVGAYGDSDLGTASGSAYVFRRDTYAQLAKITPSDGAASDNFGYSVAVGSGRIVVGSWLDDDPTVGGDAGSAYMWTTPYQTHFLDQLDDR